MTKNNSNKWISSNFLQNSMFTGYAYEKNPFAAKDLPCMFQALSLEEKMGKTMGQNNLLQ